MATDQIITNKGNNISLYRSYTENGDLSATLYLAPSRFSGGISQTTPLVTDTEMDVRIPITNGTVNDNGDNQLTGSSGGDNTTDNTTTFKEGAGVADATAQNLIKNDTNATAIWTISNLATNGTNMTAAQPFGLWYYIKDATTLAKIVSMTVKLGSDSSNYYYLTTLVANLVVGWNWITSGTTNVNGLTETGTVAGNIDTFIIETVTNNATDTFVAGDVIYDLLRQWAASDLIKTFSTGPTFDYIKNEVTIVGFVPSTLGNGFLWTGFSLWNQDTVPLMSDLSSFGAESKSSTDEFTFTVKNIKE